MRGLWVNLFSVCILGLASGCMEAGPQKPPAPRQRVITTPPSSQGAADYAQEIEPIRDPGSRIPAAANGVRVALLLPLSGESKELGQAMMDAATLALYDTYFPLSSDQIRAKIILMPKDTGNSPSSAVAATEQAIKQGASLIIGPLFSSSVTASAPVAKAAGVPMISLSNNKAIASENVYTYGFLPEQQVARVSEYAAVKNISSIAALLPNDAYGLTVRDELKANLSPKGVRVEPVEMFARTPANLAAAASRMKQAADQKPLQALFLSDGGEQLKQVLAAVKTAGISTQNVRLIGTGLWDDEVVIKDPEMQGAWFATSPARYFDAFERRFTASYGYKPQRLAGLSYDAVTLAATLALQTGGANFSKEVLTKPEGYVGPANGLYRLNPSGTSERALAVMEINGGTMKPLDAAPRDFSRAAAPQ